jgi:hypothetical protein
MHENDPDRHLPAGQRERKEHSLLPAPDPERVSSGPGTLFNTATITVGGLYLATHSVAVTLMGTTAATTLTCWVSWLAHRRSKINRTDARLPPTEAARDAARPGLACGAENGSAALPAMTECDDSDGGAPDHGAAGPHIGATVRLRRQACAAARRREPRVQGRHPGDSVYRSNTRLSG